MMAVTTIILTPSGRTWTDCYEGSISQCGRGSQGVREKNFAEDKEQMGGQGAVHSSTAEVYLTEDG